jgi:integrase
VLKFPVVHAPQANSRDWKRELSRILTRHNGRHAWKDKEVSHKTQEDRRKFYFAFFEEIWHNEEKTFQVMPRNLGNNHVKFMVARWVRRGLAPGTIQLYLSYLRTFCEWIGKPGMVLPPQAYVTDPKLVERTYGATLDKSWTPQLVDPERTIGDVIAFDPWVGTQLLICWRYGIRVKEAIMIQPHLADLGDRLLLEPGTKGGRPRYVPIDTPEKRAALDEAKRLVRIRSAHLGRPGKSLKQNMDRFRTVMKKFGITGAALGVTPHGLRHEFGNDLYEALTGEPSPVRSGEPIDRDADRAARLVVAERLGHGRRNVTRAYLGGVLKPKPGAPSPDPEPEPGEVPPDASGAAKEGGES